MKKLCTYLCLFAIVFMVGIFCVSAASPQVFPSSLHISSGSTHVGKERDYDYKNHKISLYPTRIWDSDMTDDYRRDASIRIGLNKKGVLFWGDAEKYITLSIPTVGQTETAYFGNMGSGTFKYSFNTGTGFNPTGDFDFDPVYMYSYE